MALAPLTAIASAQAAPAVVPAVTVTTTGTIKVVASGTTAHGGWVTFTGIGTVKIDGSHAQDTQDTQDTQLTKGTDGPKMRPDGGATAHVGGGTWYYGSGINGIGQKSCTSQYYHPSSPHSSSIQMDYYVYDHKDAGLTTNANFTRYTTTTCQAFWSVG